MMPTRRLAACGSEFQVPGKIEIYHPELRWLVAEWAAFQEACIRSHGVTPVLQPPGPRLHLGKNVTALERRRAEQLDRLTAWTENRSYERIRRAVPALLAFTGGVTKAGKEWLRKAAHMAAGTTECAQRPVATEEPKPETEIVLERNRRNELGGDDERVRDPDDVPEQDIDDEPESGFDDVPEQDIDDEPESGFDDVPEQDIDDKAESGFDDDREQDFDDKAESGFDDDREQDFDDEPEPDFDDDHEQDIVDEPE